ncbi:aminotransferase class III-fold pyridoxal phosphate-dependent enzyme [Belnapia sp. T18]|uniref:Aminotransferase class III-fold pyridoxal phosphate-dependent enzyme n=1 Tax=Belnapia arida TaxID=2804533 RepID=A0ABS1UD51_9PROT|nr:aminotransferase class III-fold pyridoxal phosphate-dependent enzyme [Belnapia arida]MBL6082617.1 aminotransferase class III-fold pyridoxal phosphate-dependent enzyme [Belnapia arida]
MLNASLLDLAPYAAVAAGGVGLWLAKGRARLALSRAKHNSLAGHVRMARRIASAIPFYEYNQNQFFCSDNAPESVVARREDGFFRLAGIFQDRFRQSAALTVEARQGLSDLQFTSNYRVPFQYSRLVREHLTSGSFLSASQGVTVTDLDGNIFYDLTGSHGVNLLGYDSYKACIAEAVERVGSLGPVLGAYHPVVADNVADLQRISGQDEISFHMSGTEAVMQAVRLARYHTGRTHLVRFCGAYHGWWDDVQPGIGNPAPVRDTYTLAEMSERTLHVLRTRRDIACVLVNPLQALHPNAAAPADSSLVDSSRAGGFDRQAYSKWLCQLREVCTERGIVLIFDEVFVGFRLALGGAQEYFGIRADLVTYGKTLGGGLPIGVLCGRSRFMRRFSDSRPGAICFARGTFNSHPYVMGAMRAFLDRLQQPDVVAMYARLDMIWNERAVALNERLKEANLPVRIANLSTIWTVCYTHPSRYNWMLQYYLRAQNLALSWVGTGRLIFSLNYNDSEFKEVADRFVAATRNMDADGWWTGPVTSNQSIRRGILREMLHRRWRPCSSSQGQPGI